MTDSVIAQKAPVPLEVEEGKNYLDARLEKVQTNHFVTAVIKTME